MCFLSLRGALVRSKPFDEVDTLRKCALAPGKEKRVQKKLFMSSKRLKPPLPFSTKQILFKSFAFLLLHHVYDLPSRLIIHSRKIAMARRSTEASTRSAWMVCAYLLLVFISPVLLVSSVRAQDAPQEPLGDKAVTGPSKLLLHV